MVCVCLGRAGCWCSRLNGVCLSRERSRLLVQQIKWCVFVWEEKAVGAAG